MRQQYYEQTWDAPSPAQAAYSNNWRDAIENTVEADQVAALVREIMADRAPRAGSASDLLLAGANVADNSMVGEPLWLAKEPPAHSPDGRLIAEIYSKNF